VKDSNSRVRASAVTALGQFGASNPVVVLALVDALNDPDSTVRANTVKALGQLGAAQPTVAAAAAPALIAALKDVDSTIRATAADALGQLAAADPVVAMEVAPALVDALKDVDSTVRTSAADALGKVATALTPVPSTPIPVSQVSCRVQGGGSRFKGSCSPGNRLSDQIGSCITGQVIASDGSNFKTVLLSVDTKDHTIRVPLDGGNYDPRSGAYSICKLGAGEWGVTVINVNRGNAIEENPSQGPSQVIVRLSGADGEHAIVNFRE
jgi:hypothetical protein